MRVNRRKAGGATLPTSFFADAAAAAASIASATNCRCPASAIALPRLMSRRADHAAATTTFVVLSRSRCSTASLHGIVDVIAGRLEADAERLDVPEQQDRVQRAPAPVKMTPSHAVVFLFVCATSSTKSLPHFAKLGVSGPLETPSFKKIPEPCAKN